MIKKLSISSIFAQLLLLIFVFVWIAPTFGLFISSLRDKDVLAISGWWTSFTTTDVNEIYRTKGMEAQIKEDGYFIIKDKVFEEGSGKIISRFGITSKNIDEFEVGEIAYLKMVQKFLSMKQGTTFGDQKKSLPKKKVKEFLFLPQAPPALL